MNFTNLAISAARAAARLRADFGVAPTEAVCPFDLADRMGIDVRLVSLPSFEGMYSPGNPPTIVVSNERPPGRRRYTCGHEIGHHIFGHGTRIDELSDEEAKSWVPEEFIAQRFAGALLMPKLAIESAFVRRGWSISDPKPEMAFAVAQEFGVGFTSLITHLQLTLKRLPHSAAETLRRIRLPKLRDRIAGFDVGQDIVVVDNKWGSRKIDLEVGDALLLPADARFVGNCLALADSPTRHFVATAQGFGSISLDEGRSLLTIRVSRQAFTGLARYRHLEEIFDNE